jgi:hypothetical protein
LADNFYLSLNSKPLKKSSLFSTANNGINNITPVKSVKSRCTTSKNTLVQVQKVNLENPNSSRKLMIFSKTRLEQKTMRDEEKVIIKRHLSPKSNVFNKRNAKTKQAQSPSNSSPYKKPGPSTLTDTKYFKNHKSN